MSTKRNILTLDILTPQGMVPQIGDDTYAAPVALLDVTGNQTAFEIEYIVNKAAAGDDIGLVVNKIDTASPGVSLLADFQVSGASKFSVDGAGRIKVPQLGGAAAPTISFGDGDTGFYEEADDSLMVSIGGLERFEFIGTAFSGTLNSAGGILNIGASNIVPSVLPRKNTPDIGMGSADINSLSLIAGGVEQSRWQVSGNHIINSLLDESAGNEAALSLNYTTNKSVSGDDTGLIINQTDVASPGVSLLADFQVGGISQASIDNVGALLTNKSLLIGSIGGTQSGLFRNGNNLELRTANITVANISTNNSIKLSSIGAFSWSSNTSVYTAADVALTRTTEGGLDLETANTSITGAVTSFQITPTYNQISGDAANTDLLINRTETAVGSGEQLLVDFQVGGVSKFSMDSEGIFVLNTSTDFTVRNPGAAYFFNANPTGITIPNTAFYGFSTSAWAHVDPDVKLSRTTEGGLDLETANTSITGTISSFQITPTYNQASGDAANTDLLINRTETAIGSGIQLLADFQVGGISQASIDNTGTVQMPVWDTKNNWGVIKHNGTNGFYFSLTSFRAYGNSCELGSSGIPWKTIYSGTTRTETTGNIATIQIKPIYNQASGDAANTDLLINRTETAVGSGTQLLADFQVGGVSKVSIDTVGNITLPHAKGILNNNILQLGGASDDGNGLGVKVASFVSLPSTWYFGWGSGTIYTTPDTKLYRDELGVLAQRNDTTAQTFRIYNTYTDASNYERLSIGGDGTIATEALGTGIDNGVKMSQVTLDPTSTFGASTGIAFGDGDVQLYESSDDNLVISFGSDSVNWKITGSTFGAFFAGRPGIRNILPSATSPNIVPAQSDSDTGLGAAAADQLSLIAGGIEGARIEEGNNGTVGTQIFIPDVTTAPTGNATGGGYLFSEGGALKWRGSAGTVTTIAPA